jgi:hypothetical protein
MKGWRRKLRCDGPWPSRLPVYDREAPFGLSVRT